MATLCSEERRREDCGGEVVMQKVRGGREGRVYRRGKKRGRDEGCEREWKKEGSH